MSISFPLQVQSESNPHQFYQLNFQNGIYSCTCLAWRKQRGPLSLRTCKHLIKWLGSDFEETRAPESFAGLTRIVSRTDQTRARSLQPKPMLFHQWKGEQWQQLISWHVSTKLDGVFARWDGVQNKLFSKTGRVLDRHPFQLPKNLILEGELFPYGPLALHGDWRPETEFHVFDIVLLDTPWHQRHEILIHTNLKQAKLIPQKILRSVEDILQEIKRVEDHHDEGLIFRNPNGTYSPGTRSYSTLKWKPIHQGQARVLSIDKKGILNVQEIGEYNTTFKLRRTADQIITPGNVITFRFYGRTEHHKPEFPSLLI